MTMRERLLETIASCDGGEVSRRHHNMLDAILAEMETPSEEVVEAAYNAVDHGSFAVRDTALRHSYASMIRAIREGK